jgi:hypothetical protein
MVVGRDLLHPEPGALAEFGWQDDHREIRIERMGQIDHPHRAAGQRRPGRQCTLMPRPRSVRAPARLASRRQRSARSGDIAAEDILQTVASIPRRSAFASALRRCTLGGGSGWCHSSSVGPVDRFITRRPEARNSARSVCDSERAAAWLAENAIARIGRQRMRRQDIDERAALNWCRRPCAKPCRAECLRQPHQAQAALTSISSRANTVSPPSTPPGRTKRAVLIRMSVLPPISPASSAGCRVGHVQRHDRDPIQRGDLVAAGPAPPGLGLADENMRRAGLLHVDQRPVNGARAIGDQNAPVRWDARSGCA